MHYYSLVFRFLFFFLGTGAIGQAIDPAMDQTNKSDSYLSVTIGNFDTTHCITAPKYRLKTRPLFARMAFHLSGGPKQYNQTLNLNSGNNQLIPVKDIFPESGIILHRIAPVKLDLCVYTRQDSILNANALIINGNNRRQNERFWVNYLLGNFFLGYGPENIYFPPESNPSKYLSEARIVKRAIKHYNHASPASDSIWIKYIRFGILDLASTMFRPLSIKHFTGSAEIRISNYNDSLLLITVVNISSITSADFTTHYKRKSHWPRSIPRQYPGQPLSNTCQVYHILVPQKHHMQKD